MWVPFPGFLAFLFPRADAERRSRTIPVLISVDPRCPRLSNVAKSPLWTCLMAVPWTLSGPRFTR